MAIPLLGYTAKKLEGSDMFDILVHVVYYGREIQAAGRSGSQDNIGKS